MRLFIAIDFEELKDYFAELQSQIPTNAKLSLAKTFHLTLKFLGEVQQDKVDGIISSLKKIKFEPFSVSLDSIGVFSSESSIRVVWIGLKPEEKVIELQKKIDNSLKILFNEEKNFKAHITLARVRFVEDAKPFIEELKKIKVESKKVEVKEFKLMKSTLTAEGPVYEGMAVFKFN